MNTVAICGGELIVKPRGLDKLWGFRRELRVPLAHVQGATADASVAQNPPRLRLLGLSLPGKHVGTFFRDGQHSYWNISNRKNNVVIDLTHEGFAYAVLTVKKPTATARTINDAIHSEERSKA